ncbi:MAG: hypothetical protein ACR2RF_18225 [Geminicoccaceae bacterium]
MMIAQRVIAAALLSASLAGCSVGMALSGDETPDLSVVKIGAAKDDVELQLGQPHKVAELENGAREAAYKFEVGNDPNAIRAIGHGALDVASLGLWEIVGTPIEVSTGKEREVSVTYDELGMVTKIEQTK